MDINTQISTTKQQAKRLLELGLKKSTADCYYNEEDLENTVYTLQANVNNWNDYYLPAWSLHRLIALCEGRITIDHESSGISYNMSLDFYDKSTIFDNLIDCIQWLIEEGGFNENYLEDQI